MFIEAGFRLKTLFPLKNVNYSKMQFQFLAVPPAIQEVSVFRRNSYGGGNSPQIREDFSCETILICIRD